jgi:hypothetical protein
MHEVRVTEIADRIHQLRTYPDGVDVGRNQCLAAGEEPLPFRTGLRSLHPRSHRRSPADARCGAHPRRPARNRITNGMAGA